MANMYLLTQNESQRLEISFMDGALNYVGVIEFWVWVSVRSILGLYEGFGVTM